MTSATPSASSQRPQAGWRLLAAAWRLLAAACIGLGFASTAAPVRAAEPAALTDGGQSVPDPPDASQPGTVRRDPVLQPRQGRSGVLVPPDHVDPGINRRLPDIPPQSMPVIHPRQLHASRHGPVLVVPK